MRISVTGASGFVGRYVLAELERYPVEVFAVTRNLANLSGLSSRICLVELDISSPGNDCFKRMGRPDVLIHLAWDGLPNYNSAHHIDTELPNHQKFLKMLVDNGLRAMFVAGTCFEYGMQSGPLSAATLPRPNSTYGCAKDVLRQQLQLLQAVKPFDLIWGRMFYMYGEGQSGNSLYSQLKEAVARKDRVFNMSGGEQLRDYLPVTDVAKKIVALALEGRNLGAVNICSGKPVSVRRLVEQWLEENNWNIELNLGYYPYPDYEPMEFWGKLS